MPEQANVQARKKAARKKSGNSAEPGPESQLPPRPQAQIQQVMAVVVPVEIYEQMKRCCRSAPYEDVELLMQAMRNLVPQQVNMSPGPAPGQG